MCQQTQLQMTEHLIIEQQSDYLHNKQSRQHPIVTMRKVIFSSLLKYFRAKEKKSHFFSAFCTVLSLLIRDKTYL